MAAKIFLILTLHFLNMEIFSQNFAFLTNIHRQGENFPTAQNLWAVAPPPFRPARTPQALLRNSCTCLSPA